MVALKGEVRETNKAAVLKHMIKFALLIIMTSILGCSPPAEQTQLVYQAKPVVDPNIGQERIPTMGEMDSLMRIIEDRMNASGLGKINIQIVGGDQLLIQLSGVQDLDRAKWLIGQTGRLEFKHRKLNVAEDLEASGIIVAQDVLSVSAELVPQEPLDQEVGPPKAEDLPPVIIVEFTPEGARKFAEVDASIDLTEAQALGEVPFNAIELSVGDNQTPSNEILRYTVLGPRVDRVGTSNRFAFPFPADDSTTGPPEPLDLARAKETLGDASTVKFVRLVGSVDEDFGLSGDNLTRAYSSLHSGSNQPIINIAFDDEGTRLFWGIDHGDSG